jgi:hypothetical protein
MGEQRQVHAIRTGMGEGGEPDSYEYFALDKSGREVSLPKLTEEEMRRARILAGYEYVDNGYGDYVNITTLRGYFPQIIKELGLDATEEK